MKKVLWMLLCAVAYAQTPNATHNVYIVGNTAQPVESRHSESITQAILNAGPAGTVIIPNDYAGTECNPVATCNLYNIPVIDLRGFQFGVYQPFAFNNGASVNNGFTFNGYSDVGITQKFSLDASVGVGTFNGTLFANGFSSTALGTGFWDFKVGAAPSSPAATFDRLYIKSGDILAYKKPDGTEIVPSTNATSLGGNAVKTQSATLDYQVYSYVTATGQFELLANTHPGHMVVTPFTTGTDMCDKIHTGAVAAAALGWAILDATAFTGPQVCKADTAPTMLLPMAGGGGRLELGNVALYVDGKNTAGSVVANFSDGHGSGPGTPAWIIPNKFYGIHGNGGRGDANVQAGTSFGACAGNNNPVPGCTTSIPVRSFAVNGHAFAGTTPTKDTLSVTGATTSNVFSEESIQLRNATNATCNRMYTNRSLVAGALVVVVPDGTASCGAANGTVYLSTPLIGFGPDYTVGGAFYNAAACLQNNCVAFGGHISGVNMDCQFVLGCEGFQNIYHNENSAVEDYKIINVPHAGFEVDRTMSQNFGPIRNGEIYSGAGGALCDYGTVAGIISTNTAADRGIEGLTFSANTNCANGIQAIANGSCIGNGNPHICCTGAGAGNCDGNFHPRCGLLIDRNNVKVTTTHSEGYNLNVCIGQNLATAGVVIDNLTGPPLGNTTTAVVQMSANYGSGTTDISTRALKRNNGTQETILDEVNATLLGNGGAIADNVIAGYSFDIGNGITCFTSTSPTVPSGCHSTFANLGAPVDGTIQHCTNCTIANPCAAGGTGAFAKRLNGIWVCN